MMPRRIKKVKLKCFLAKFVSLISTLVTHICLGKLFKMSNSLEINESIEYLGKFKYAYKNGFISNYNFIYLRKCLIIFQN